jgi:hypothetical protein
MVPLALSQEYITAVDAPVQLRVAGAWTRVIHTGDEWKVAFSTNSSFWIQDLVQEVDGDPSSWVLTGERRDLQDRADTKDHSILRCPDGTYLHIASANIAAPNDSAYGWRYDEDFNIIASVTIEEGVAERHHNDMVMMCSRLGTGVIFPSVRGSEGGNVFFPLDDALSTGETFSLDPNPYAEGGALLADRDEDIIYHTGSDEFGQGLVVRTYDADWQTIDYQSLDVIEPPMRPFWPQRLMQVGDHFLLAFVARNDQNGQGNGGEGNIYVAVLDSNFQLLERQQISTYPDNAGKAMRPWMARSGTRLMVSYDAETEHTIAELTLNAAAFGLDEDDLYADTAYSPGGDGAGDGNGGNGANDGDSGAETPAGSEASGCGDRSGRRAAAIGAIWLVMLMGARRRRQGAHHQ